MELPAQTPTEPERLPHPHTTLVYRPRRPEYEPLYRILQLNLESFLATVRRANPDNDPVPPHVEKTFRRYLKCSIPAWGFARARCPTCGFDFIVPFSCKCRGLCPSCSGRYMVQTAAHLVDNVMPWRNVRQIVLTVPKRIRFFLTNNKRVLNAVIRIFMRALETDIRKACPDAPRRSRIGAVVFVQRSGSSLNVHIHLHVVATIGVYAAATTPAAKIRGVRFCEATELTDPDIQAFTDSLTGKVRKRVLRWMVKNNLLEPDDAAEMLTWQGHGGFSIDASVHIPAHDRHGLERLLRYCARPPFAAERISLIDQEKHAIHDERHEQYPIHDQRHFHRNEQPPVNEHNGVVYHLPPGDIHGRTELALTPFQFIHRLAQLIPPPRLHRNRYFGALAAASPLRPHVVKFASPDPQLAERLERAASQMKLFDDHKTDSHQQPHEQPPPDSPTSPPPEHRRRRRASILWAMLLARIYEVWPLVCPRCSSAMKLISFITDAVTIEKILAHLGLPTKPPPPAPARDPPQVEMMFGGQVHPHPHQPNDRHYDPYDQTHWP